MAEVIIFEHSNFQGLSQVLPMGRYDDANSEISIGNDTLSSLQVPPGLVARLYDHYHFQGRFIDFKHDTPIVSQYWQERTSSIVVYGENEDPPFTKEVMIFEHDDYAGASQSLEIGRYDVGQVLIGDQTLSSALVPYGMVLRLYDQPNFSGNYIDIRNDTPTVGLDWNDKTSSIVIDTAPIGLWITSNRNIGVIGESCESNGVRGISHAAGHGGNAAAIVGVNDNNGPGVFGQSAGTAIWGESKTWMGVFGKSESTTGGAGVMGEAVGSGVIGVSKTWIGVYGETQSSAAGAGIWGEHKGSGNGVVGMNLNSNQGAGVHGEAIGTGVRGISKAWTGVYGEAQGGTGAGVWGEHKGSGNGVIGVSSSGIGVFGKGGKLAGLFEGDVEVTGDIRLTNADCAEDFDISDAEQIDPGTVMVVGTQGKLEQSRKEYDKRVAGVVSGAGAFKPGIVLDKQSTGEKRQPIALLGKVYCKVDTRYGKIEVGDLLTTSLTPGHARKAEDPIKAFGAVIGKALEPISQGAGMIPILVALQ